jgi:large subunit ribosomal protein L21
MFRRVFGRRHLAVYAIIRTGGKQYRVEPGDTIYVEQLEAPVGETIDLEDVLLVGDGAETRVGVPRVPSAKVVGRVLEHARDAKVRVFKYKKRKHYRRTRGHRQAFTALRIEKVEA